MPAFPNPDAYLNHLPPVIAGQLEVARNLTIAVFGAAVWDIFIYMPNDIGILRRSPFHLVSVCFMSTRFFATAFVLLSIMRQTVPAEDCNGGIPRSIAVTCLLANVTSSFLLLQRLRAVFSRNYWVQRLFFILWLATNGLTATTIVGATSGHIRGTKYCVYIMVHGYVAAVGLVSAFFDTAVFVAVSYKISVSHSGLSLGVAWDTVVSGRALPRLSRAVLQGGQQYYLITISFIIPGSLLILLPGTPPPYKLMLSLPLVTLRASMACRVFRNLRLQNPAENRTHLTATFDTNFVSRSYTQRFLLDTGEAT